MDAQDTLAAEETARLTEFARACKAGARAVLLYPAAHPAIKATLGRIAQVTVWQSEADCRRYIREGAAATVATIEDAAVPTAPYPNGNWVRHNFVAAGV